MSLTLYTPLPYNVNTMKKADILTKNQARVHDFIKGYIGEMGQAPSIDEIAKELGVKSLRTVTQYLEALERKGLIRRERYAQRGIKLIEDEESTKELISLPVFASAGCGSPSVIAECKFDEFINVSADLIGRDKKDAVVIRAVGNSMLDAGIRDGDFVLVRKTENANTGDIVVAIIDETAVIKKIAFADNAVILSPVSSDPLYHPIILSRDFRIFGKVIKTIKVERSDDFQIVPIQ